MHCLLHPTQTPRWGTKEWPAVSGTPRVIRASLMYPYLCSPSAFKSAQVMVWSETSMNLISSIIDPINSQSVFFKKKPTQTWGGWRGRLKMEKNRTGKQKRPMHSSQNNKVFSKKKELGYWFWVESGFGFEFVGDFFSRNFSSWQDRCLKCRLLINKRTSPFCVFSVLIQTSSELHLLFPAPVVDESKEEENLLIGPLHLNPSFANTIIGQSLSYADHVSSRKARLLLTMKKSSRKARLLLTMKKSSRTCLAEE